MHTSNRFPLHSETAQLKNTCVNQYEDVDSCISNLIMAKNGVYCAIVQLQQHILVHLKVSKPDLDLEAIGKNEPKPL